MSTTSNNLSQLGARLDGSEAHIRPSRVKTALTRGPVVASKSGLSAGILVSPTNDSNFASLATQGSGGAIGEVWYFLRHNKKWWLTPIVLVIVLLSLLIFLAATGAAPLIYTLF